MTKILFVCHGNICRSPMAEFVMRDSDILSHVTINHMAHFDGKDRVMKTDRYIVRVQIN